MTQKRFFSHPVTALLVLLQGGRGDALSSTNHDSELEGERQLALCHRRPSSGCPSAQVLPAMC